LFYHCSRSHQQKLLNASPPKLASPVIIIGGFKWLTQVSGGGIVGRKQIYESKRARKNLNEIAPDSVVPPYYLPAAQLELQEYLDHLVSELPRPVFLCDVSALTKGRFEPDALRRFAAHAKKTLVPGRLSLFN